MAAGAVGEPTRKTTRPRDACKDVMSVKGVSIVSNFRVLVSRLARRELPLSMYEQMILSADSNAYINIPKTHCGIPNSAFISRKASMLPSSLRRYRFHQPLLSETK